VELAQAFGTHALTITKWQASGLPIAERGSRGRPSRYRLPDCVQWFIRRELHARGVGNGHRLDPLVERAALDRQRRETLEFDLARKRGEYVRTRDAERLYSGHVLEARNQLRAIPSAARHRLNLSRDAAAVLAELIDTALEELAVRGESRPGDEKETDTDADETTETEPGAACDPRRTAAANGAAARAGGAV
jgi:phage terminase Nu1 subunit (DNA packaging protein)